MRRPNKTAIVDEILGQLLRRHSTAAVLLHHALAERLGLGPTDHKCLDLLRQRGPMTGSALAALTGLTTGAITGVVARLEVAGFVRREDDPEDGRKQILHPVAERLRALHAIFEPIHADARAVLAEFDLHQITAIAEFLTRTADSAMTRAAALRAERILDQPTRKGGRRT